MKVLVHTLGTAGDEAPLLAIAEALHARGHEAVMLMNPTAETRVRKRGLEFAPVWESWRLDDVLADPEATAYYLHPTKGATRIMEDIYAPNARAAFEATKAAIADGTDVVVSHLMCMGSSWAAQDADLPYAHVTLAPVMWGTLGDDAAVFERPPPRFLPRLWWWIGHALIGMFCRSFDGARRDLGLPPKKAVYFDHIAEADVQLGMWPPAFRPLLEHDPSRAELCGFCLADPNAPLDPALVAFLDAGEPPVVVGLGSSLRTGADAIYRQALTACAELGRRIVLVGAPADVARGLGDDAFTVDYAPYAALFPRAAAVVHPAGAGTNGEALRAGKPTVTVPYVNDQFDNALRAARLGTSVRIPRSKLSPSRLRDGLERALTDATLIDAAREIGAAIAGQADGAEKAADAIERLAAQPSARAAPSPAI